MKKGKYIDYNILLAALSHKPVKTPNTGHLESAFSVGNMPVESMTGRRVA